MDAEAAQQIFSAGEHLEQAGKLAEALACYQQATKLNPQHYYYHYKLGGICSQQDELDWATQCFERAIALNSNDSWSYHALGEICAQQSQIDAAINYYQQAIEHNPSFSWSNYNLACLYQQRNQWAVAKVQFQQAIALEPDFFWSHYFLAETLDKLNERTAAIAHYQKAIELNPEHDRAYYHLARHLQQEGKLAAAVEYYRRCIEGEGADFDCYYFLAETLIQLQRTQEALDYAETAIALQPNNLLPYYQIGSILSGRGEKAIANYRKSAANKPLVFRVNLELGLAQAWEQQGKLSKSIAACQRAIKIDPTAEMPYRIMQYLPINSSAIDSAIAFYRRIGSLAQTPLLWGNLGDLLTKQGRIDEAIDSYRRGCQRHIVSQNPELADLDWQQSTAPDFIIVGASKCGTTSLFFYLSQHPYILLPHKKEIDFFNRNFHLGVSWYLAQFPAVADARFITGEASPLYIYDPLARARIKQLFPNIKIIMMLRNPVARTISEYYHAVNHDLEHRSLLEIVETEREILATQPRSEVMTKFGYLFNSIYLDKIKQWQADFPPENILVIDSESFFEQTDAIMQQVWQFLGLPAIAPSQHIRYNVGSYPPVSPKIEQELQKFFTPYNRELAAYLNRSFSW